MQSLQCPIGNLFQKQVEDRLNSFLDQNLTIKTINLSKFEKPHKNSIFPNLCDLHSAIAKFTISD